MRRAAGAIMEQLGGCDVFVHAAATFARATLPDLALSEWRRVQAVNVEAMLWLCQALTPGMIIRGFGRVVMIVSDTVWGPPAPDLLAYVASNAALIGVARSLAAPLGAHGVTVNCVAPGLTPYAGRAGRGARAGLRGRAEPSGAAAVAGSAGTWPAWSRFSPPMRPLR